MPRLRFPGFEGAWKEYSLEIFGAVLRGVSFDGAMDVCSFETPGTIRLLRSNNVQDGRIVVDEIKIINRDCVAESQIMRTNDILICMANGSKALVGKAALFVNFSQEYTFGAFMGVFRCSHKEDAQFVFHLLHTFKYRRALSILLSGSSINNLRPSDIEAMKFHMPWGQEQEKLSYFLSLVDARIAAQRKLVELLKKHKRGLSNGLFSKKIHIAKSGDWKVCRLGDIVRRVTRKNGAASAVPLTISAQHGLIDQREFFSKSVASADMSGYYLLKRGEFAYNRSSSGEYPFGSIKRLERYAQGAVSTLYLCFEAVGDEDDAEFLKWYFDSFAWHREVGIICAEGARNHGLLNVPTDGFFDTRHTLPADKMERKAIASLMSLADARCRRAESELSRLTELKTGLLQQLFV